MDVDGLKLQCIATATFLVATFCSLIMMCIYTGSHTGVRCPRLLVLNVFVHSDWYGAN